MDIFPLRIHIYNIIDGIVGMKFSLLCKRKLSISIIFRSITWYYEMGGIEEAEGESQRNAVYGCGIGWCYLVPNHFANV